jgi:hypothetical protein
MFMVTIISEKGQRTGSKYFHFFDNLRRLMHHGADGRQVLHVLRKDGAESRQYLNDVLRIRMSLCDMSPQYRKGQTGCLEGDTC